MNLNRLFKIITVVVFVFFEYNLKALEISPQTEISLLTCSPGQDLYSVFGHSAIRINDPTNNLDFVVNYGTFHFSDDFYLKFALGKLNYTMSQSSFAQFYYEYESENRSIFEQQLNLTYNQKIDLIKFFEWNYLPENRIYKYDFFYDNCATRIRDALEKTLGNNVSFNIIENPKHQSFRIMIDNYMKHMDWSDFGIDLALGLPCDKKPTPNEYVFLPDELFNAISSATINNKPLVKNSTVLFDANNKKSRFIWLLRPIGVITILSIITIFLSIVQIKTQTSFKLFDKMLFGTVSILGFLLLFLWFFTDHTATAKNFNLLWSCPILLGLNLISKNNAFYRLTLKIGLFYLLIVLTFLPLAPQQIHYTIYPIIGIMVLRITSNLITAKNLKI